MTVAVSFSLAFASYFSCLIPFFLLFSFLFGCLEATNALGVAFSIYYLQKRLHCELTMVISVLLSL